MDIVEQLRALYATHSIPMEAADEIERLRAESVYVRGLEDEIDRLRTLLDDLREWLADIRSVASLALERSGNAAPKKAISRE